MQKNRNTDIDIGLHALCVYQDEEQTLTIKDIAEVCNCAVSRIQQIEQTALAKIKRKPIAREMFEDIIEINYR